MSEFFLTLNYYYLGTEDEDLDKELRGNAVSSYISLLEKPQELPDVLIKIICWVWEWFYLSPHFPLSLSLSLFLQVVGEYAYEVEEDYEVENVLEKITGLLQLEFKGDSIPLSPSLSLSVLTCMLVCL